MLNPNLNDYNQNNGSIFCASQITRTLQAKYTSK